MLSLVSNNSGTGLANNLLMLDTYFWVWSVPNSPNAAVAPQMRLGAAIGVSDSVLFIHGGVGVDSKGLATSAVLNDLTKLDESTFQWTSIANGPTLMFHTMCKLTGLNRMVIFGGSDQNTQSYNTVHSFDLTLETWSLAVPVSPGVGGSIPSARKGHTAICFNNTMIVYGGGPEGPLDDDVWVLDASKTPWVWNRMTTNKQMGPGPRTGHSALLNGTNMLVWGGYGTPIQGDTNIYILDTKEWQWSSSKETPVTPALPVPDTPAPAPERKNNLPLTIGVISGSVALIVAFVGFLLLRRRSARRNALHEKSIQGAEAGSNTSTHLAEREQQLSRDIIMDDKLVYYNNGDRDSGSSLGKRSQAALRRSTPSSGYPMQSIAALTRTTPDQSSSRAESSQSSGRYPHQYYNSSRKETDSNRMTAAAAARVGSISSDPFYPSYLAEDDEEDADRWTFASSLSFDQRDSHNSMPTLRYIPTRVHGPGSAQRSLGHSTGSLGGGSSQRMQMVIHPHGGTRGSRRDPSNMSTFSNNGSSIGPGSISLTTATSTELLNRDGSTSPRDNTLFNSVSPLDRVTIMCAGIDPNRASEDDALQLGYQSRSIQLHKRKSDPQDYSQHPAKGLSDLSRKDTTSTSTTKSSTSYTTLENPALMTLVQNLPARYKLSKSPCPIHGETNDILFAIDSDTQQPIVVKSFAKKEAWERECRMLRRLRGPYVVEMKHVATLVLSETDDPNKPAKLRLTILERLDETLAQMLKNARKAKKVALQEQAQPNENLNLAGAGLFRSGPALDVGYIKDIAKGVLRCLIWCHSKRIVYCDLKPSNVMHNRDDPRPQWKLIDLESSRVANEECIGIGTVRYCPPEVARGTTVDKQASSGVTASYSIDLWAFGCLLYELFATRPLFPLSLSDDTVLHFLAHPSTDTPSLANGLRWNGSRELEIPHFEEAVPDEHARTLIRMLLHPDPLRRATLNQILASQYLSGSGESKVVPQRSPQTSPIRGNAPQESQPNNRLPSSPQYSHPLRSPQTIPTDTLLKEHPCLLIPLPNLAETQWLDPSTWTLTSFKIYYLCQHPAANLDSSISRLSVDIQSHMSNSSGQNHGHDHDPSTVGHFVEQPGYVIERPQEMFKQLSPLLLLSLDLQISRMMDQAQCPPGFEALVEFEYDGERDLGTLGLNAVSEETLSSDHKVELDVSGKEESHSANAAGGGIVRGFAGYCQWIRSRIYQLGSKENIDQSIRDLEAFTKSVDPGYNATGLQLFVGGSNQRILICSTHAGLPEYSNWKR
ncbi:hypothetical protein BGW38_008222, partial [Lunasporangiospora selenospora]